MDKIDEGGYLITPREFEERMKAIEADTELYEETRHEAADELMVKVLNSLGYSAGTKIFDEMEKWYA